MSKTNRPSRGAPGLPGPSDVTLGFLSFSGPPRDVDRDIYTICLPDFDSKQPAAMLDPGRTYVFNFQRYHQDSQTRSFSPVFPEDITLKLDVLRLRQELGRSGSFPHLVDMRPKTDLYTNVCQVRYNDPVVNMLTSIPRMVFRYEPNEGMGFLVHAGYDWSEIDAPSLLPLWRTAINQRRTHSST